MLKPVSAKDALYVESEANTLSVVFQILMESGFAPEDAIRKLNHDGEKGVQMMNDCKFLVKKQLGKHNSQIVPTLWDAFQLQMEKAFNGDGNAMEKAIDAATGDCNGEAATGDCNGEGAEDPAMDMENAANGDGNGYLGPMLWRSNASEDLNVEDE